MQIPAELMAAFAVRAGADIKTVRRILDTVTTEEAIEILENTSLLPAVIKGICDRIHYYLQHRCGGAIPTEAVIFSNAHGYLGETPGAQDMIKKFTIKEN